LCVLRKKSESKRRRKEQRGNERMNGWTKAGKRKEAEIEEERVCVLCARQREMDGG
jgi:hypothetical protein